MALIGVEHLDLYGEERRKNRQGKVKRIVMRREKQTQNPKRNVTVAMDTVSADHLPPTGLLTSTPAST